MISDKDFYNTIKMLFEFADCSEILSRINNDTGLRESGITIVRNKNRFPEMDSYTVTINWKLLNEMIGDEEC